MRVRTVTDDKTPEMCKVCNGVAHLRVGGTCSVECEKTPRTGSVTPEPSDPGCKCGPCEIPSHQGKEPGDMKDDTFQPGDRVIARFDRRYKGVVEKLSKRGVFVRWNSLVTGEPTKSARIMDPRDLLPAEAK